MVNIRASDCLVCASISSKVMFSSVSQMKSMTTIRKKNNVLIQLNCASVPISKTKRNLICSCQTLRFDTFDLRGLHVRVCDVQTTNCNPNVAVPVVHIWTKCPRWRHASRPRNFVNYRETVLISRNTWRKVINVLVYGKLLRSGHTTWRMKISFGRSVDCRCIEQQNCQLGRKTRAGGYSPALGRRERERERNTYNVTHKYPKMEREQKALHKVLHFEFSSFKCLYVISTWICPTLNLLLLCFKRISAWNEV